MTNHTWSEAEFTGGKYIETCICGCERITQKHEGKPYTHYLLNGKSTQTAPVCAGNKQQTSLFDLLDATV